MSDQMTFDKWLAEWGPMHHACDRKEFARAAWDFQQSRIQGQALDHMVEVNQLTAVTDAQLRKKAADRYRASQDSVVATAYLDGYRAALPGGEGE